MANCSANNETNDKIKSTLGIDNDHALEILIKVINQPN